MLWFGAGVNAHCFYESAVASRRDGAMRDGRPSLDHHVRANRTPTIAVAYATSGRREVLSDVVRALETQTRRPDKVFIAPAAVGDVDEAAIARLALDCAIVRGPAGLTAQRNTLLRAADAFDLIVYFDDDFLPAPDYLENCEAAFGALGDMVVMTGEVLLDGAHSPGVTFEEAQEVIARDRPALATAPRPTYNAYGCNMVIRGDVARAHGLEFDEALPLYGWFEDVDFSRRMSAYGKVLQVPACRGVHLATKRGKGSGVKLGYAQIVNPCYLAGKGSLAPRRAAAQIARNVFANILRVLWPEPWIDRRGRLWGNVLALRDLARGRADPRRILTL